MGDALTSLGGIGTRTCVAARHSDDTIASAPANEPHRMLRVRYIFVRRHGGPVAVTCVADGAEGRGLRDGLAAWCCVACAEAGGAITSSPCETGGFEVNAVPAAIRSLLLSATAESPLKSSALLHKS